MTTVQPISVNRLHDVVVEELETRILKGEIPAGERLPSEQQLAEQLNVGRRAVREALKVLQAKGLVEVRMGVGAFVTRNDLDNYIDSLSRNVWSYLKNERAQIAHIQEFRSLIEGEAIKRLTKDRDEAILAELREAISDQEKARETEDGELYSKAHFGFHLTIVHKLHNPITEMLYREVLRLVQHPMQEKGSNPEIMKSSIREHKAMLEAIEDGDVEAALARLDEHLRGFRLNLEGASDGSSNSGKAESDGKM